MSFKIEGLAKAQEAFLKRIATVKIETNKAIKDVVMDLTGKSVALAPIDTGDLRGSGKGEVDGLKGTVSFGTPYALKQHEHTEYHHPQGGQAKYLEQPFVENTPKYIKHIQDSVKGAVE